MRGDIAMQSITHAESRGTLDFAIPSTHVNGLMHDICMWFVYERGNWLSTATWVSLFDVLDVPSANVRTALHRMTKAGYLDRSQRDSRPGYAMSQTYIEYFMRSAGGFTEVEESHDRWALVTFNVPEGQRADRHAIRSMLRRNGFAPLGNAVWIAAAARLSDIQFLLEASGLSEYVYIFDAHYRGFVDSLELVHRCWDLDAIGTDYRDFIRDARVRLEHQPTAGPQAFADLVVTSNRWRQISTNDPVLPLDALPPAWPRAEAKDVRRELIERFLGPAREYVDAQN
jgi:phenylacetic acid degradation operon negative regulatory protein